MLGVVGSNLKMVKFFMQHLWMLHDVVVVCPGMRTSSIFNSQHVATRCNRVCVCATCYAQQCCDLLRLNVAIVWPELANAGPTLLGYVALRCWHRLAGALQVKTQPNNSFVTYLNLIGCLFDRCINQTGTSLLSPDRFDPDVVLAQVSLLAVVPTVQMRNLGFPVWFPFDVFT